MEQRRAGCEHKAVDSGGSRTGAGRTLLLHDSVFIRAAKNLVIKFLSQHWVPKVTFA